MGKESIILSSIFNISSLPIYHLVLAFSTHRVNRLISTYRVNRPLIHSLLSVIIAVPNVVKQSGAWLDKGLVQLGKPGGMGLPRFSLKRYFFYVLCLTGTLLVLLNLLQDEIWHSIRSHPPGQPQQSVRTASDLSKVRSN